jgi:hypothetical protein
MPAQLQTLRQTCLHLLQVVVILSFNCSDTEAFAIVGLEADRVTACLLSPVHCGPKESMRVTIYSTDFSMEYHGNPMRGTDTPLKRDAWAIRLTPYATTHGATWAERVRQMPKERAWQFLGVLAGLTGFTTLPSTASCLVEERERAAIAKAAGVAKVAAIATYKAGKGGIQGHDRSHWPRVKLVQRGVKVVTVIVGQEGCSEHEADLKWSGIHMVLRTKGL